MGDQQSSEIDLTDIMPGGANFEVRLTTPDDTEWIDRLLHRYWATVMIFARGRIIDASKLPGIAAFRDDEPSGLITYLIEGDQCQIVTHNSLESSGGIGSCLLAGVRNEARRQGCKRLWLMTTNDNTSALKFYQRRDFDIVRFHHDSLHEGQKLKRSIPDRGHADIPIRHEFELEFSL